MKTKMYVCICMVVLIVVTMVCMIERRHYNDGNCIICGTEYKVEEKNQAGTYYRCPECKFGTYYWK